MRIRLGKMFLVMFLSITGYVCPIFLIFSRKIGIFISVSDQWAFVIICAIFLSQVSIVLWSLVTDILCKRPLVLRLLLSLITSGIFAAYVLLRSCIEAPEPGRSSGKTGE